MKDKVETEVTKLSLDEALCVTSLGLKELTEGQGVKGKDYVLFTPDGEKLVSLPIVIFKDNSKYQPAHFQSSPHSRYGKVF